MLLFLEGGSEAYQHSRDIGRVSAMQPYYVYDTEDGVLESNVTSVDIGNYIRETGILLREASNGVLHYSHDKLAGEVLILGKKHCAVLRDVLGGSKFTSFYKLNSQESIYRFMNHIYFLSEPFEANKLFSMVSTAVHVPNDGKRYMTCGNGVLCLVYDSMPHLAYLNDNNLVCVDGIDILADDTEKIVACMRYLTIWRSVMPYATPEIKKELLLKMG